MQVNIIKKSQWRIPRQFVEDWVKSLSRRLVRQTQHKVAGKELTVVFVDSAEIKSLNHQFRAKNKATDILSFGPDPDFPGAEFDDQSLGELVLCGDIVDDQARDHQLSQKEELGYLLIHGVLHLLGYEHEKGGPQAKKMFALQDKVFQEMCRDFF